MKLIWVNCFLPLDCCYLLATANVAALFLRWSVFPYVLTETAQFSTQHSVSKTKIAIREALHVSKQMYHFHVNILTHSCFTACGSGTPRIVVIVHFRILTYFHLLTARATLQINCTRWYALPVRWRFDWKGCAYIQVRLTNRVRFKTRLYGIIVDKWNSCKYHVSAVAIQYTH